MIATGNHSGFDSLRGAPLPVECSLPEIFKVWHDLALCPNICADSANLAVLLVVLLITAQKIYADPAIGLGVFMSVYLLSRQMQTVTGKLFTSGTALMGDAHYMKDFFDLQDIPKEPEEKKTEQIKDADIVCDHVSFSYPNSEREVLHDVSITIRQGEKIAIVGHNGSGKSTFVNLLCGICGAVGFPGR